MNLWGQVSRERPQGGKVVQEERGAPPRASPWPVWSSLWLCLTPIQHVPTLLSPMESYLHLKCPVWLCSLANRTTPRLWKPFQLVDGFCSDHRAVRHQINHAPKNPPPPFPDVPQYVRLIAPQSSQLQSSETSHSDFSSHVRNSRHFRCQKNVPAWVLIRSLVYFRYRNCVYTYRILPNEDDKFTVQVSP